MNDYLKRAGIEVGSPDAREDSHAAVELHRHQVEVSLERRAAQAHRSRVQHARHNLIRWFGSRKEDSEPLGECRSQFDSEASVRVRQDDDTGQGEACDDKAPHDRIGQIDGVAVGEGIGAAKTSELAEYGEALNT